MTIVRRMVPRTEHPAIVHRRRERDGEPVNDRRLRRLLDEGAVIRIVAGSYANRASWDALTPLDRHYLRVLEGAARARGELVVSHFAAAAVWCMDILGSWPARVDVRIDRAGGGRSSGAFRRRALGLDDVELVPWQGHWITSPAQTAIDLAGTLTFTKAVVALDQALWAKRSGGALTDIAAVRSVAARASLRVGARKLSSAIDFATSLSDSVRETQSRVLIDRMGFPAPVLQRRFDLPSGRIVHPDFFFEDQQHAGEFDGLGKYLDPLILRGRTPEEALIDEKDRADELMRVVRGLSRWRTPALTDPRQLYDILAAAGLPTRQPRPRPGQHWA